LKRRIEENELKNVEIEEKRNYRKEGVKRHGMRKRRIEEKRG
jgi:hypothetical protein